MRHGIAVGAVVGLLVLGVGGSFALAPPATTTADRFAPTVGTGQSVGTFYARGAAVETRSIAVDERGAVRTEATFDNLTGVRYWNGSDDSVYRVEATNEAAVDRVVDAYDESAVVDRSDGVAVVEEERERPAPSEWWNGSLVMTYLQTPEYERTATETRRDGTVVVYEPSSSFVRIGIAGGQTMRVSNPTGEVVVDADTGRLLSADVSYEVVRAESWGRYLVNRATGDSGRVRVTYEYRPNASVTPVDRDGDGS